jgi:hypothetical protein
MPNLYKDYVASKAKYWGLGIASDYSTFVVVVECNDGTVVINGGGGSGS